jgi:hypothetical protein
MAIASSALDRRLARYRAATRGAVAPGPRPAVRTSPGAIELATRLAEAIDAEVVRTPEGVVVRAEQESRTLPVDRARLAALPGQPPTDVPLVCLDTETTGLATAAGTVAFLIGLGWWEQDRFRQVQLVLPEHAEERALLTVLAAAIPCDAWLVTYNGRGFDWPLLVARYRLAGRAAPAHAGHLDLLPVVRRLFRHRMPDARLRTAEAELLGLHRYDDVDGGEIPERYFGFLRGGPAENLVAVVRHNDQDVRSLARLLGHLEAALGDAAERAAAPAGDLGGLARAYAREHRLAEALACLELATTRTEDVRRRVADSGIAVSETPGAGTWGSAERWAAARSASPASAAFDSDSERTEPVEELLIDWWRPQVAPSRHEQPVPWQTNLQRQRATDAGRWSRIGHDASPTNSRNGGFGPGSVPRPVEGEEDAWWSPARPPDFGGRPLRAAAAAPMVSPRSEAFDTPWTAERLGAERAHLLRRLGRYADAAEAWTALAAGPSRLAIVAAIELAKLREHRLRDHSGALAATAHGLNLVERRRRVGRPEPRLEADLRRRLGRLKRRSVAGAGRSSV